MKTLTTHINEALKIGKNLSKFSAYSYKPENKEELEKIIKDRISKEGQNCDLNDIDVSQIDDMSFLFYGSNFNVNISYWYTSNVKDMFMMFSKSKFTGDISGWDVSKVEDMRGMFAFTSFNQDISKWNVSKVTNMKKMFAQSKFNLDISNWNIREDCKTVGMFDNCPIKEEYKPESIR